MLPNEQQPKDYLQKQFARFVDRKFSKRLQSNLILLSSCFTRYFIPSL